jgi:CheY-like chemotaxis protein/HPt (histidine-containing phosphotransfer) domain-containing protein
MAVAKTDHTENTDVPHLKILVVDDDELNRRMMKILLTREGHHVDLAANGMEALDAVKYQEFDIVFMDLQMPTMDGVEASNRIRQWENGGRHTFIVALTASYLPEEGHVLFSAGIDNYISKPFEVDHIQRMLSLISRKVPPTLIQPEPVSSDVVDSGVLDIPKGIQRVGGDRNTFRELLSDFIKGMPGRMETLERYLQDRDIDAVSREAHNLRGVAANLGALELAECASKLDKQGNEGYTRAHEGLFLELKRAKDNLIKTANGFLANQESTIVEA